MDNFKKKEKENWYKPWEYREQKLGKNQANFSFKPKRLFQT